MRYLIDTNTLITAKNDCYRFDVCPPFWTWLAQSHNEGHVFSVQRVKRELDGEKDVLTNWANKHGSFFLNPDSKTSKSMGEVAVWVQGNTQFFEAAKAAFFNGADPELIAHAHAHGFEVVTFEKDEPNARARVKIPTVCNALGVKTLNLWQLLSALGARI